MSAKSKVSKSKVVKNVVSKKSYNLENEVLVSGSLVLGFISIASALVGLAGTNNLISILALVTGSLAVWLSVRNGHYHVLFGGVAGLLVALVGILNMTNGLY